jgi:hypothetical protein
MAWATQSLNVQSTPVAVDRLQVGHTRSHAAMVPRFALGHAALGHNYGMMPKSQRSGKNRMLDDYFESPRKNVQGPGLLARVHSVVDVLAPLTRASRR